jgi:hypothetical protein
VGFAVLSGVGSKGTRVGVAGAAEDKLHASNIRKPSHNKANRRMIILLASIVIRKGKKGQSGVEKRKTGFIIRTRFVTR